MARPAQSRPSRKGRRTTIGVAAVVVAVAVLFLVRWRLFPTSKAEAPGETAPPVQTGMPEAEPGDKAPEGEDWALTVVSAAVPLDRAFTVDLEQMEGGYRADTRISGALRDMLSAARADDVALTVCSGYRGVSKQTQLYNDSVQSCVAQGLSEADAKARAGRTIQPPGCSEHHTGLALDIVAPYHQTLDEAFDQTAAYQWLKEHAAEYGFVLRYPKGKEALTGIDYEPWHFRYVGAAHAQAMAEGDLCLEEYVAALSAAK